MTTPPENDLDAIAPVYRPDEAEVESARAAIDTDGHTAPERRGWLKYVLLVVGLILLALVVTRCVGGDSADDESGDAEVSTDTNTAEGDTTDGDTADDSDAGTGGDTAASTDLEDAAEPAESNDEPSADTPSTEDPAGDDSAEADADAATTAAASEAAGDSDIDASTAWTSSPPTAIGEIDGNGIGSNGIGTTVAVGDAAFVSDAGTGAIYRAITGADWTQIPVGPAFVVDMNVAGDGQLAMLSADPETGTAVTTWTLGEPELVWRPFELPASALTPNTVATASGRYLVTTVDTATAAFADRPAEITNLLREGGIDLSEEWIAGADETAVTYLDPAVPVGSWTEGLLTRTRWATFGIDDPDWPDSPATPLLLVTDDSVTEVPYPFGPNEFLLDLSSDDGEFRATTWDGSAVEGPTLWTSTDGLDWSDLGPTGYRHAPAADGPGTAAGDVEYRLRTLGSRPSVIESRTDGDWTLRPLRELAGSTIANSYHPDRLVIGGAAIVIRATNADDGNTILLLSRDGETWEPVDPGVAAENIVITDTSVTVIDASGNSVQLTPTR